MAYNINDFSKNVAEACGKYFAAFSELQTKAMKDFENDDNQAATVQPFLKAFQEIYSDPSKMVEYNAKFTRDYLELCSNIMARGNEPEIEPKFKSKEKDSRFQDESWDKIQAFDFLKQYFYMQQEWINNIIDNLHTLDPKELHKLKFYTKQFIDAISPSNFAYTNPAVIKEIIDSNGQNLLKGANNLLKDIENSQATLKISTVDSTAFEVGKNIACTKGSVIFQNDLMQLIQYEALTEKVHKTPILIITAWINKYYILDLQAKNSFVRWMIEEGYTVFMISWVNPDSSLSHKSYEDYMNEGPLAAIEVIKKTTGEDVVNCIGYCLGGTLLATTLSYLSNKKDKSVKSATFLTTLIDFEECGDIGVFIDEDQIQSIEKRMSKKGYMSGDDMASTFSMLRANDMIWSFYINNYLLGKDPMAFDILYWNSDSTRLPAKMHSYYLRNMYHQNMLVKPGGIIVNKTPIDLKNITLPTYIFATKEDHIAPWHSAFKAMRYYKGTHRFVLSASGHVAGVVNHPSKEKYCYWVNEGDINDHNEWFKNSKQYPGSWWLDWKLWAEAQSGGLVDARKINAKNIIEAAPGSYVLKK